MAKKLCSLCHAGTQCYEHANVRFHIVSEPAIDFVECANSPVHVDRLPKAPSWVDDDPESA